MALSEQQLAPVKSVGNARINAVAGSGKTTTLVQYAAERKAFKILYLAFNKSVKDEAIRKFSELPNVIVETAHSLAYRAIVIPRKYKVVNFSLKPSQLVKLLKIEVFSDSSLNQAIAIHVLKYTSTFCNSSELKVASVNYVDTVKDSEGAYLVEQNLEAIQNFTRQYLQMMKKGEVECSHDFYLKEFQLSNPLLTSYQFILFDEGQDASPVMLDIFLKQSATKVIVGDSHQSIYGWRSAVNSLEMVDFPSFQLNKSWRFDSRIAAIANEVLSWKQLVGLPKPVPVVGMGSSKSRDVKATIGRKNISLLASAIEQLIKFKTIETLYFEGGLSTYTFSDSGSSLFDIINLYLEKTSLIRDTLISSMGSLRDLKEHAKLMDDKNMSMLIELVEEYGERLPYFINEIKSRCLSDDKRDQADMIFSTVHRAKGLEYDEVTLLEDFITREEVERQSELGQFDTAAINEEINLLYVAVTRARFWLNLPGKFRNLWSVCRHVKNERYVPVY